MKTVRDPDVVIATWLEDGPTALPDSTRRAIATAIEALPQRRPSRLPWRFPNMNAPFRLVVAAAIIVAAAIGGFYLLRPGGGLIGGPPTVSPSPRVSPTSTRSEPLIGTATLGPTDCTFKPGPTPVKPGTVRIELVNVSQDVGGFDLHRIRPGSTYEELAAIARQEDALVRAGKPFTGALGSREATWDLPPGETFPMIFDAFAPGGNVFALVCTRIDPGGVTLSFTPLGPLEVR